MSKDVDMFLLDVFEHRSGITLCPVTGGYLLIMGQVCGSKNFKNGKNL